MGMGSGSNLLDESNAFSFEIRNSICLVMCPMVRYSSVTVCSWPRGNQLHSRCRMLQSLVQPRYSTITVYYIQSQSLAFTLFPMTVGKSLTECVFHGT